MPSNPTLSRVQLVLDEAETHPGVGRTQDRLETETSRPRHDVFFELGNVLDIALGVIVEPSTPALGLESISFTRT